MQGYLSAFAKGWLNITKVISRFKLLQKLATAIAPASSNNAANTPAVQAYEAGLLIP
jgi:hypothetical protein